MINPIPHQISRYSDIGSEKGYIKEPYCNKECPNMCSSNYWNVYDAKKNQWNTENTATVTVECSKFHYFKSIVSSMNYL